MTLTEAILSSPQNMLVFTAGLILLGTMIQDAVGLVLAALRNVIAQR